MTSDREPGWSRTAQDATEGEHPPSKEPQEDSKVRAWSVGATLLAIVAAIVLLGALWALGSNGF